MEILRTAGWPIVAIVAIVAFRPQIVGLARAAWASVRGPQHDRRRSRIVWAVALMATVCIAWWTAYTWIEHAFPAKGDDIPWEQRGQFGDTFGAVTSLMTALNLALLVYALLIQAAETARQNEIAKWQSNYTYLLEAKKLIVDHPEVLELHGLARDLPERLDVTPAQIAYVVVDLKAADLYYKIDGRNPVVMTPYRLAMITSDKYRRIARACIVTETMLPPSPFVEALSIAIEEADRKSASASQQDHASHGPKAARG